MFKKLRQGLRKEKLDLERDQGLAQLSAGAIGLSITGGTMAWMVWQALQGRVTLGSLALFYQAFNQGQRMMRSLLANTGQIYYNVLFLGNLFEFLDLGPKIVEAADPRPVPSSLSRGIQFDNVTFRYPTTGRLALDGFNLVIVPGQVAAIVGRNEALLPFAHCFSFVDLRRKNLMMRRYLELVSQVPVYEICFQAGLKGLPRLLDSLEAVIQGRISIPTSSTITI